MDVARDRFAVLTGNHGDGDVLCAVSVSRVES